MSGQHRLAPSPELLRQWRTVRWLLAAVFVSIAFGSWWPVAASGSPSNPSTPAGSTAAHASGNPTASNPATKATVQSNGLLTPSASDAGWLVPGSDPRVLPGPLLISDTGNNRLLIIDPNGRTLWEFPRPGDMSFGEVFKAPGDAFFTPDGKQIIVAQGSNNTVRVIDVATRRIAYTYGTPGVSGSGPNHLRQPESALMLPSGDLIITDIKNCRIIVIRKGAHAISKHLGSTGSCVAHPPQTLGAPSGFFPMTNGNYLMTETKGSWITEMSPSGRIAWSVQLPGAADLSGANEIGPNRYLTTNHSSPGEILIFNRDGKVLWRYGPTGEMALDMPSLALPLAGGNVVAADSANHRVIVVDPSNRSVVWQYGQIQAAGSGSGSLNNPTGLDLYPPNALLVTHAKTMGKIPR